MDSFLLLRRLVAAIVFKGQTVSDYWWSRRTIFLTEPTTYVNRRKRTKVEIKQPRATPLFFFLANVWGDSSSPERHAKARCVENGTNAADVVNEEVEAAGGIPFECVEGSEVEADGCLQNATVSGSDVSHHYNNMARQHT